MSTANAVVGLDAVTLVVAHIDVEVALLIVIEVLVVPGLVSMCFHPA